MKKYEINLNGKIIWSIVLPSVVFFFHVHEANEEIDDVRYLNSKKCSTGKNQTQLLLKTILIWVELS